MKLRLRGRLPYVSAVLGFQGKALHLEDVVLDTGSAASVFSADEVAGVGILPEPTDSLYQVRGVGGFEFIYSKRVDWLECDTLRVEPFEIQVGALDYGFPVQGLLGLDFLIAAKALIDLGVLEIRSSLPG